MTSPKPRFKFISPQYIDLLNLSAQEVEQECGKLKSESKRILAGIERKVDKNCKFKVFHYVAWDGQATNFDCLLVFANEDLANERLLETRELEKQIE